MSDKDRRIWMLNADLQAGRAKLPLGHEFKREYLGEWKDDRADAMAYAATATVAHRCALCSEVLSTDGNASGHALDVVTEQHHVVCPKRSIEIGDYVRWDGQMDDGSTMNRWMEGEVIAFKPDDFGREQYKVQVRRVRASDKFFAAAPYFTWPVLRRVPRPAEAQATCTPDCRCDPSKALRPRTDVMRDEVIKERYSEPPAPVLVDGVDREVCLARWMENRLAVEGGAAPPNAMTRMQRDAARALWLERFGAKRSADLRAKVSAGPSLDGSTYGERIAKERRERDRARVRVDRQDEP